MTLSPTGFKLMGREAVLTRRLLLVTKDRPGIRKFPQGRTLRHVYRWLRLPSQTPLPDISDNSDYFAQGSFLDNRAPDTPTVSPKYT